jgi:type IV pilus assembly protein PilX
MNMTNFQKDQQGAALIVGLVLLVVITVLAISGMNTATTELAMARNDQNYENAFQAAETGLENSMGQGAFNTNASVAVVTTINAHDSVSSQIAYEGTTIVPDRAFSLGSGSGVSAYHFLATATAKSQRDTGSTTDRDSAAVHTQAFYIVGPGSPTL